MNRCKTCRHYTSDDFYAKLGGCSLILDFNDIGTDHHRAKQQHSAHIDRVFSWDCECCKSDVYVGEDFGCVHHHTKDKP